MSVYKNTRTNPLFNAVEFSPVSDGNFTFFYIDNPLRKDAARTWLARPEHHQEILAETQVEGHHVFVTHGDKTKEELLSALQQGGDHFAFSHSPKGVNAWALRGMLGIGGQGLQLTSSLMRHKLDIGLFVFAVSNIAANIMGMTLGAQKSEDTHRLRHLKEKFNTRLDDHLPAGEGLPKIDERRAALHKDEQPPKSAGDKLEGFLRRNSVYVGELGLRYLGAFALAFPMNKWGKSWTKMKTGAFKEAYDVGRNPSTYSHVAGIGSLVGKNIAFFSKPEDPYDPAPKSRLDNFREKYTFRLGGWIEAASFGTLSYGAFKEGKIKIGGKQYADYLSGTGGAMFTLAYVTRHWAKFGVKEMNMEELYAHVADSLAQMPPEKLPRLMADTAADIKEHFKDKPMDFGKIFTQLMTDLYRYHHIALDNLGTEPQERQPAIAAAGEAQPAITAKHTLKHRPRAGAPYADKALQPKDSAELSL